MRYDKKDVLNTLRTNRQAHKTAYRAARAEWREQVKARYERALRQFEKGSFKNAANPLNIRPRPKHHLGDYDAAITRIEAAVADARGTVPLNQSEYAMYLRDNWGWATTDTPVTDDFPYVVGFGW